MTSTAIVRDARVESWEDHVEAWHHLGRQADGAAWGRAAIAASVKGRWGEVSKFADEVGFTTRAVRYYASTFEAFPESGNRFPDLTFTHHLHAVALTADVQQAKAALDLAGREGWSANALRAHLRSPALLASREDEADAPERELVTDPAERSRRVQDLALEIHALIAAWPSDAPTDSISVTLQRFIDLLNHRSAKGK